MPVLTFYGLPLTYKIPVGYTNRVVPLPIGGFHLYTTLYVALSVKVVRFSVGGIGFVPCKISWRIKLVVVPQVP